MLIIIAQGNCINENLHTESLQNALPRINKLSSTALSFKDFHQPSFYFGIINRGSATLFNL